MTELNTMHFHSEFGLVEFCSIRFWFVGSPECLTWIEGWALDSSSRRDSQKRWAHFMQSHNVFHLLNHDHIIGSVAYVSGSSNEPEVNPNQIWPRLLIQTRESLWTLSVRPPVRPFVCLSICLQMANHIVDWLWRYDINAVARSSTSSLLSLMHLEII